MSDIRLVWNAAAQRCDWTIANGRLAAGADLESVVLLLLFTDRHAQTGYVPSDGSGDLRGVWFDTFEPVLIGSRLWQLWRLKISNRGALGAMAQGMVLEALQPMLTAGLVSAINCTVQVPAGVLGRPGTFIVINILLTLPTGRGQAFVYNYTLSGQAPFNLPATISTVSGGNYLTDESGIVLTDENGVPLQD